MANPSDIVDIIQTPILIKDEFIKNGSVIKASNGIPIHYVGGFAIVFPYLVENQKWAFRCWYNNIGNIGRRLKILSKELERQTLKYFCEFTYVDQGIVIDGMIKPTTRMLWIDGLNIKEYICKYAHNKYRLRTLADNFKQMCNDLHQYHIAHGDLQHGNIIVNEEGNIFLIDYDSLYLPALKGEKDIITGLSAYQHPSRIRGKNVYANEKLDYFSELVIYLSIISIMEFPNLVQDLNIENADNLLFTREDYGDILSSSIYEKLKGSNDEIQHLLDILVLYLSKEDILELNPFDSYEETISTYCIHCGMKFSNNNDLYCINCGEKRI